MAEVAFAVPVIFGIGGIMSSTRDHKEEDNVFSFQAWDPLSDYYRFERQYNDIIDKLLMDQSHGRMGNKIPISEKAFIPGEGKHRYFKNIVSDFFEIFNTFNEDRVNFYKKIKSHNG